MKNGFFHLFTAFSSTISVFYIILWFFKLICRYLSHYTLYSTKYSEKWNINNKSTLGQHLLNMCGFQGSFSWASIQCRLCYEVQFFTRPEPREFSWNDPDIDDSNLWLGRFCNLQSRWKLNKQYAYQATAANSQWVSIVAPNVTSKSCTKKISRKQEDSWKMIVSSFIPYLFYKKYHSLCFWSKGLKCIIS